MIPETLREAVRAEVSGERALGTVRTLARHHRIQATPGYDGAARELVGAIEAAGLRAVVERAPADGRTRLGGGLMPRGWWCERARATLVDGATREVVADWNEDPLSLVQRSAPAAGRFPVVRVDDGSEDAHYDGVDVRGAVVLTAGPAQRVHRLAVVERGAAGLLCHGRRLFPPVRGAAHDPASLAYTSFWWGGEEPRGWGFVLSPARGARLADRLAAGATPWLEVDIESRAFDTTIPLVSACVGEPSRDPGAEVLLVAHLCHPRPGANDNASGVAAALEAARALEALRRRGAWSPGRRAVRVLWMPEFTGTWAWLGLDPQRAGRVAAALNLDMVGEDQAACGSTLLLETPPCFLASFAELVLRRARHAATEWILDYSGPGHVGAARTAEVPYGGGSDHAALVDPAFGVPCPMLIQWPDRYYHSSYDTAERCDPRSLALAARSAALYAAVLAAGGPGEAAALAGEVRRDAVARLADAHAAETAARARLVARERLRGAAALASLARLGADAAALAPEQAALERAARALAAGDPACGAPDPGPPVPGAAGAGRVPARVAGARLEPLRHLLPGWWERPRAEREAWRALEAAIPGGPLTLEVAWLACDGRRDLAALAHLVWLERGLRVAARGGPGSASLEAFFELARGVGLVSWTEEEER